MHMIVQLSGTYKMPDDCYPHQWESKYQAENVKVLVRTTIKNKLNEGHSSIIVERFFT